MRKFGNMPRLQNDDPGAAGGGAAAPAVAAAPAPAAATPAAPAPAPATATALSAGAPEPGAAPAPAPAGSPAPGPNDWMAEKFRVMKEDGSLDVEASARKMAESHGHLEKRMGSGDAPPKSADDYKINIPEAFKDTLKAEALAGDAKFKEFRDAAHAKGMSQGMFDFVIGEFFNRVDSIGLSTAQQTADECVAQLKEGWKTDAEYNKNLGAAFKAGQAYAGSDFDGILKDHGNDPRIIRLLAKVGAEMGEDKSPGGKAQTMSEMDVEALVKSPAYMDPSHPEHSATKQKVTQFFERKYGNSPRQQSGFTVTS